MIFRSMRLEERQLLTLWGGVAAVLLATVPFWPQLAGALPACPVHALTGFPCLSCGTTRAFLALGRGALGEAFSWNPLSAAGGIVFGIGGVVAPIWALLQAPVPDSLPAMTSFRRGALVAVLLLAWSWQIVRGI